MDKRQSTKVNRARSPAQPSSYLKTPSAEDVKKRRVWEHWASTFSRIMRELGGWSQEQADAHLEARLRNDGFRFWFSHDDPSTEAAPLLLPEDLRDSLKGLPRVKLCQQICEAVDRTPPERNVSPDTDPRYDWESARQRVAGVIEKFRSSND
jgi:hypothetical protein